MSIGAVLCLFQTRSFCFMNVLILCHSVSFSRLCLLPIFLSPLSFIAAFLLANVHIVRIVNWTRAHEALLVLCDTIRAMVEYALCHLNMRVSGVCILCESNCFQFYIRRCQPNERQPIRCWIKKFVPHKIGNGNIAESTIPTDCQFTERLIQFGIHWE